MSTILTNENCHIIILEKFINNLLLDLYNQYLNKLKINKLTKIPSVIIKFLDVTKVLINKKIKIYDIEPHITKMSLKEKREHIYAIEQAEEFRQFFNILNFIYCLIKTESLQIQFFNKLYLHFKLVDDDFIKNFQVNKKIHYYKILDSFLE